MRCPLRPPAAQIPHLQPQQPQGLPAACWPPCPPHHVTYNPFTELQYYPGTMPMLSSPQFLPPVPAPGGQTPWFQTLVAAISRSIQDDEGSVAVDIIDREQETMSSEDEKALIEALNRWKEDGLRMPEVFDTLSKMNGHTATQWKTWFISNFEVLDSKVGLTQNNQAHISTGGTPTTSISGGHVTSRNRSSAETRPSRSSATRLVDERTRSRKPSASVPQDLGGDVHGSASRDWRYVSDGSGPLAASARQRSRHVTKNNGTKTTSNSTRVLSRAREHPCPVTREDLRAMALYLFEKGDDRAGPDTLRRRNFALWREFAARPENRKRTLDAWTSIPRLRPKHAAEIERYLKVFQKDADAAKSGMAAELESSLGKHVPRGGTRTALESAADPVHVTGG